MKFYAHTRADENENLSKQLLSEHLYKTANYCKAFAAKGVEKSAYIAGLLHDVGKYQNDFQRKLNGAEITIEHSGCGAEFAVNNFLEIDAFVAYALAYAIMGHHGGLPDGGCISDDSSFCTLLGRLKRKYQNYQYFLEDNTLPNFSSVMGEFKTFFQTIENDIFDIASKNVAIKKAYSFYIRMLYSCLTDADFLDTESFCQGKERKSVIVNFSEELVKLDRKLNEFKSDTTVQKSRKSLQQQAFNSADKDDADVYLLNMPTGSGKTLCSLRIAMKQAIKHNKKRIIYVIPYTSIIEQTAGVFSQTIDKKYILQHHSNYDYDDFLFDKDDGSDIDVEEKMKKAAENWDMPIIITTNVQFFESIYSNKSSKLRKFHNMADSIIVFDEVHMLPIDYMAPCIDSVAFLTRALNSKAIFLTATMPNFKKIFSTFSEIKPKIVQLITDKTEFQNFQNAKFIDIGECDNEKIVSKALEQKNALIIVNSRRKSREIFKLLQGKKYHLSTYLSPVDRSKIIDDIKKDLCDDIPISVVSTSLIEAGVDLDFATVFRELAGLDNILQAGGRCNREGKLKEGSVYIFSAEPSNSSDLAVKQNITKAIIKKYVTINCSEAISDYYDILYKYMKDNIVLHSLEKEITIVDSKCFISVPFRSYAENFKFINSSAVSVAIPNTAESRKLAEELRFNCNNTVKRKLQRYSASIFKNELNELIAAGVISDFGTGQYVLTNIDYYDSCIGLITEGTKNYIV